MAETITNLVEQVSIEGCQSPVEVNIDTSYSVVCELSSTTVIVAYSDVTNNLGVAKVGIKASQNCVTWGDAQTFLAAAIGVGTSSHAIQLIRLSDTAFLAVYKKNSGSKQGFVRHGTVDVNAKTITWGTESAAFGTGEVDYLSAAYVDTDVGIITYRDVGDANKGYAVIVENAAGTISFGTPVKFQNSSTSYTSVCVLNTGEALVCYCDGTNGAGMILSISGSTITTNAAANFLGAALPSYISCDALSSTTAVVIYTDPVSSDATCCIATVSAATITWGSLFVVTTGTSMSWNKVIALSATKFAIAFIIAGNDINFYIGTKASGGTSITYGAALDAIGEFKTAVNSVSIAKIDSANISCVCVTGSSTGPIYYGTATAIGVRSIINNEQCKLFSTGKSGGYSEITSIYVSATKNNAFDTNMFAKLYLKGTAYNNIIYTFGTGKTASLNVAGNPIILDDGDELYIAVFCTSDTQAGYLPVNAIAFGIDVVTS